MPLQLIWRGLCFDSFTLHVFYAKLHSNNVVLTNLEFQRNRPNLLTAICDPMKRFFSLVIFFGLVFFIMETGFGKDRPRRPIVPKECRVSKYTCVLKKVDGVPFYCVRLTKQRYQNARKKMRIVSKRTCLRRYPVEYKTVEPNPKPTN